MNTPNTLPGDFLSQILERLGLSTRPAPNLEGLHALYAAWCLNVPFDNVRKMIALRAGADAPLPGVNASEFFDRWLTHGAGGTCWSTSNALFALADAIGFDARRIACSMRDLDVANHGSVKVRIGESEWLVDSSMLFGTPLPLDHETFISDDTLHAVEIERVNGTHLIWNVFPTSADYMPCRVLVDPADHEYYRMRYEVSRERSPFNDRLYARRNRPNEIVVLAGNVRHIKSADGVVSRELNREELLAALHDDIGLSETLIQDWVRSGAMDASFVPASDPPSPPLTVKPPSQR